MYFETEISKNAEWMISFSMVNVLITQELLLCSHVNQNIIKNYYNKIGKQNFFLEILCFLKDFVRYH